MRTVLQLQGLDCAHCAAELECELAKIHGVKSVSVVFLTQKLTLEYEHPNALREVIETVNHFEEVRVMEEANALNNRGRYALNGETHCKDCSEHSHTHEHTSAHTHEKETRHSEHNHTKGEWLRIAISAICFIAGLILQAFAGAWAWLGLLAFAAAYFIVGYPVLIATGKNLRKGKIFDENFLMTVASVGAVVLGEYAEGVAVMLLYQLGETLQGIAVENSRRSIKGLMALKSETATILADGVQKQVTPEEIAVGNVLLVKAGEKVPVDGRLLSENAVLDVKALTGEAEYREVKSGEEILSGSISVGGVFEMKAVRTDKESAASKILELVENASASKAAPEKFITKFARYYTPVVCALALVLAFLAPLAYGLIVEGALYFKDFERWARSALTFLVISCPCALVISVPLTYFSGLGACAKQGVLVKGATFLDVVAKTKIAAFDKTGTLTKGDFSIQNVITASVSPQELLAVAAAVERNSNHPIAKAFAEIETEYKTENAEETAGKGVTATIDGEKVFVGSGELLAQNGVTAKPTQSVYTMIHVARNTEYLGAIEIGDTVREGIKETLAELKKLGVNRAVMLTGDTAVRAQKIANEVGVYEVKAQLLPAEKLFEAEKLKQAGTLLYVGDGINDAPVMAASDCAVSMGKLGSAAAVEASDLVLVSDKLSALPKCIRTARKTRKIVMQNIVFSILMKIGFMTLGALGVLELWTAVFADVGVMLLAVLNSFRVRKNK